MPVTRYRDVADMPPPPRVEADDLARRIRDTWARAAALAEPDFSQGVQRFRSIEEAQSARAEATKRRIQLRRSERT